MGSMDFHHLETGLQGALGRGDERRDHILDLVRGQLMWRCVLRVERDLRWAYWLPASLFKLHTALFAQPWAIGTGLAPGVRQLYARHGALGGDETGDALQRRDLGVFPQAKVFGGDAAIGGNCHGFRDNQTGATHSTAA